MSGVSRFVLLCSLTAMQASASEAKRTVSPLQHPRQKMLHKSVFEKPESERCDGAACLECVGITTNVACRLCLGDADALDRRALSDQPVVGRLFTFYLSLPLSEMASFFCFPGSDEKGACD